MCLTYRPLNIYGGCLFERLSLKHNQRRHYFLNLHVSLINLQTEAKIKFSAIIDTLSSGIILFKLEVFLEIKAIICCIYSTGNYVNIQRNWKFFKSGACAGSNFFCVIGITIPNSFSSWYFLVACKMISVVSNYLFKITKLWSKTLLSVPLYKVLGYILYRNRLVCLSPLPSVRLSLQSRPVQIFPIKEHCKLLFHTVV